MHEVTLNIDDELTDAADDLLIKIYQQLPGWQGIDAYDNCPHWTLTQCEVIAAIEPTGLHLSSFPEQDISSWIEHFCQVASRELKFTVQEHAN